MLRVFKKHNEHLVFWQKGVGDCSVRTDKNTKNQRNDNNELDETYGFLGHKSPCLQTVYQFWWVGDDEKLNRKLIIPMPLFEVDSYC